MSTLKEKAQDILNEKTEKIVPENIKKDITIFDITGTYEGSEDVKLFDTIEDMQQDETIQENDLALVYREELVPIDGNTKFDSCVFPSEVVLDEAVSDNILGRFRSIGSGWFDGSVELSSSSFRFDGYGDKEVRITYTSSDGITYTRTDSGEEKVEFGTTLIYESWGDPFPEVFGNFMKVGGNYFDGVFKAYTSPNEHKVKFMNINNSDEQTQTYTDTYIDVPVVDNYSNFALVVDEFQNNMPYTYRLYKSNQNIRFGITEDTGYKVLEGIDTLNGISYKTIKEVYVNGELTNTITYLSPDNPPPKDPNVNISEDWKDVYAYFEPLADKYYYANTNMISVIKYNGGYAGYCTWNYKDELSYHTAENQLDAESKYVWTKQFYGKNGVEDGNLQNNINLKREDIILKTQIYSSCDNLVVDDNCDYLYNNLKDTYIKVPNITFSSPTALNDLFGNCKELVTVDISQLNLNNVTSIMSMFASCDKLENIIGLENLDLSNMTDIQNMFIGCGSLETLDLSTLNTSNITSIGHIFDSCSNLINLNVDNLDLSNVSYFEYMFGGCEALSNTSLNSILSAIKTISSGTKTLAYIGLTQTQATTCTTLSNWSACQNAGWTTGY